MKIHSLKLVVQDMPDKKGKQFAAVAGTLVIDTGETKKNPDGTEYRDPEGDLVPILEDINFMDSLNNWPDLKKTVTGMATQALTLKDMKITKKSGSMSHYVEALKALAPTMKRHPRVKQR